MKILVEYMTAAEPLNADAVADAFVEGLKTDDVIHWADEVRAAIAESTRICEPPNSRSADTEREAKQRLIEREIQRLQHELKELAVSPR